MLIITDNTIYMNISIIHHLIENTLSAEEKEELLDYYRSHRSREEFYREFDRIWNETEGGSEMPEEIFNTVKRNLMAHIAAAPEERQTVAATVVRRKSRLSMNLWRAAAVLAIIVSIATTLMLRHDSEKSMRQLAENVSTIAAAKGERAELTLPDGSKVWLNSASEISYAADYGVNERKICLSGEASFKVAKDPSHRFIVSSKGVDTEALGTEFNVCAYDDTDHLSVSLFKGSVRVAYDGTETILSPHEEVVIDMVSGKFNKMDMSGSNEEAPWRRNELVFNGETLREIAVTIERLYDKKVVISDNGLANESFVGTVSDASLGKLLELIRLTTPLRYKQSEDSIIFYPH